MTKDFIEKVAECLREAKIQTGEKINNDDFFFLCSQFEDVPNEILGIKVLFVCESLSEVIELCAKDSYDDKMRIAKCFKDMVSVIL